MTTALRFWLPDDLKQFVDEQVRKGGYISSPEFLRDLIRQHRRVGRVYRSADSPVGVGKR